MFRSRRFAAVVSSFTAIATAGMCASSALATVKDAPGCGAVITQSTTLTADVGPCTGDGLVVAANGITLNLGGHRIFGASAQSTNFAGVRVMDVHGVTVTGPGEVYRFAAGVVVQGGGRDAVRNLNVHDNNSTQFSNDNPSLALLGDGIDVLGSSYDVISHNYVHGNGPYSGISVLTYSNYTEGTITGPPPEHNVITENRIVNNNVADVCLSNGTYFGGACTPGQPVFNEDIGVRIEGPQADFNTVAGNVVTGSGRDGISVLNTFGQASAPHANVPQNTDSLIIGNNSSANGAAVVPITDPVYGQLGGDGFFNRCYMSSPLKGCPTRTTVVHNIFDDNPAHGLALDQSQGNTVEHNQASGNGFGSQTIYASEPPYTDGFDINPGCDDNTWLHNELGTVNQPCVRGNDPAALLFAAPGAASGAPAHMPARPGGRAAL